MNIPKELYYTDKHEWLLVEGDKAMVGITDHAQEQLGDIVFVSLPQAGQELSAGDVLCEIESVKAVSYVYSPVGGKVCEINEELSAAPEMVNKDAYGAWFVKLCDFTMNEDLMDAEGYEKFISEGDK